MQEASTFPVPTDTPSFAVQSVRMVLAVLLSGSCVLALAQQGVSEEGLRLSPSSDLSSRGIADYISTGAAPISIRSQALPPQQSIRIDAGQRVEVPNGNVPNGGVLPNAPFSAEDPLLNRSRSEFQQLIFKTRGKDIEHFGLNLFGAPPSSYAITDRIAPPASYIIAPGDEIRVRAWGQVDMDFASVV